MRLIGGQMVRNWPGDVQDLKRGSMSERGGSNRKWEYHHFAHYLSSNINEIIRAVINSLLIFFHKKISHAEKSQKVAKAPKAQRHNQAKAQKHK